MRLILIRIALIDMSAGDCTRAAWLSTRKRWAIAPGTALLMLLHMVVSDRKAVLRIIVKMWHRLDA